MPKTKRTVTVSIRVQAGLPAELRALYGVPFSELMRRAANQLKQAALEDQERKVTEESPNA